MAHTLLDRQPRNLLDPGWLDAEPEPDTAIVPAWAAAVTPVAENLDDLDFVARILATTDGSVTELLEAWSQERVAIGRLAQRCGVLELGVPALGAERSTDAIRRDVLLVGATTGRALLYAESLTLPHRLPEALTSELLEGERPIGRLLRESRLETFREVLMIHRESAGKLAADFAGSAKTPFVTRVYRVLVAGRPAMLIAEKFPGGSPRHN